MKIKFKTLTLENFMSYDDFEVEFDDIKTTLRGYNGVGKTTILSAICWCLFKKDYYDRSKFELKPIKNGSSIDDLETKVSLIFEVDGKENVIERINKKGLNTTKINGAVFKEKEYIIYIQETLGIDEESFKLVSNPTYAINLNWKDLRNIIFSYAGEVSDEDIFNENENLKPLQDKITSMGHEKVRQGIMSNLSDIKNKLLPEVNGKMQLIEQEVEHLDSIANKLIDKQETLKELDNKIEDYMKIVENESNKKLDKQKLLNEISNFENKISSHEVEKQNIKLQGEQINLDIKSKTNVEELRNKDLLEQQSKVQKMHIALQSKLDTFNKNKELYSIKENEIKVATDVVVRIESEVCPTCNKPLTEEEIKVSLEQLENDKTNKVLELNNSLEEIKVELISCKEEIQKEKELFKTEKEFLEEIKVKDYTHLVDDNFEIKELNEKKEKLLEDYSRVDINIKQCLTDIDKIKLKIDEIPTEVEVLDYKELVEQRDDLALQLNDVTKLEDSKQQLIKLNDEKLILEKKYKQSELALDLLKQFQNIKANKTKEELKKYFKVIEFVTEEVAKNGKVEDTFKVYYEGRPYETISGGEKMKSQLDLVNGIQTLKKIEMPILIDSLSELDTIPEYVTSQIITCLTVQKPKEDSLNYEKYNQAFSKINVVKG